MLKTTFSLLFLIALSNAFPPPSISSDDNLIEEHDSIGKFVELSEGDTLKVICSGRNGGIDFLTADLNDHRNYNSEDFTNRTSIVLEDHSGDIILEIKNVKESDTGSYVCYYKEHPSVTDKLYVFVKGIHPFVLLNVDGFVYPQGEAKVPCKATAFFDKSNLELYGNGFLIKDARKNYDHRTGFKIIRKMFDSKLINNVPFECKFTGSTSGSVSYLITEKEKQDEDDDDYNLYWEESLSWPYVGLNYTISCNLIYNGTGEFHYYRNSLHVQCPQCSTDNEGHAIADRARVHGNRISANIQIGSLKPEDSGVYSCVWKQEGREEDVVKTKQISVAPKKGQIKILNQTNPLVRLKEGEEFELYANIAVFPFEKEEYKAKWMRKFTTPIKEGTQSEPIINDKFISITNSYDSGIFDERVVFHGGATFANMSGTYVLSIVHSGTVRNLEWQVAIESNEIRTRISIREPSSFVVFEQPFYPPNTHLHIDCITESIPPAEVSIQKKLLKNRDEPFIDINEDNLDIVSGTYESGYIWNITVNEEIEVHCVGIRGDLIDEVRKQIRIADKEPTVTRKISKSPKATSLESNKEIYEGDVVTLDCVLPHDTDWSVSWVFNDNQLPTTQYQEGFSKHVVLTLNNVLPINSGDYTCLVKNGEMEKKLTQSIVIEKVSQPYYTKSDSKEPLVLEYDASATLHCNLLGDPMPQYQWYKNGEPYTHGDINDATLTINRVRAEDDGEFVCTATNRAGETNHRINVIVKGAPSSYRNSFITSMIFGLILIIIALFLIVSFYFRHKKSRRQITELQILYDHLLVNNSVSPTANDSLLNKPLDRRIYELNYRQECEISLDKLEIGEKIGNGEFGVVYSGYLRKAFMNSDVAQHARLPIAIKAPRDGFNVNHQRMLTEELRLMCAIDRHPNVVALVGAVTKNMRRGQLFMALELCDLGCLKNYLLKYKHTFTNELKPTNDISDGYLQPINSVKEKYASELDPSWEKQRLLEETKTTLSTSDLISFAMQIANGMEYISQIPCVHRDLAARNVLLTGNKICRIADFGLARNHGGKNYYRVPKTRHQKMTLPVRWMSIEAIVGGIYTQESDVWSFGIVLYELFTLGGTPYPQLNDEELRSKISEGYRNQKPEYCHKEIYELMKSCWDMDPSKRPTFSYCLHNLREHMKAASPEMLERLEDDIRREGEKQKKLDSWLIEDEDPRLLAQSPSCSKSKKSSYERYQVQDFASSST